MAAMKPRRPRISIDNPGGSRAGTRRPSVWIEESGLQATPMPLGIDYLQRNKGMISPGKSVGSKSLNPSLGRGPIGGLKGRGKKRPGLIDELLSIMPVDTGMSPKPLRPRKGAQGRGPRKMRG